MRNTKKLKIFTLSLCGVLLLAKGCTKLEEDLEKPANVKTYNASIQYELDNSEIRNPERGFYKHTETHSNNYSLISQSTLNGLKAQKISLVLRVFYMENYLNGPIATSYLNNIQEDFNRCRNAGVKVIVRFAYSDENNPGSNNPTKNVILNHIEQLGPVINANKDVILCIQAGFIGAWGEWYYTDHFGISNLTSQNLADREEILTKELDVFDPSIQIAVRTPKIKRNIFGTTNITPQDVLVMNHKSRVAQHNDAFLGSSTDEGTYSSNNIAGEQIWLSEETKYVYNGGETNQLNTTYQNCPNALDKLRSFHFTYLNSAYYPQTLTYWQNNGCLEEIKSRLGYRFQLLKAEIYNGTLKIALHNTGFANLIKSRPVYVVLKNTTTNQIQTQVLMDTDPRDWVRGGGQFDIGIDLNSIDNLPPGTYELFLRLPDPNLGSNKDYSIRFANTGVWDDLTDLNKLSLNYVKT